MNNTKEIRIDGVVEVPSELSVDDFLLILESNSCYFGGSIEEYKEDSSDKEIDFLKKVIDLMAADLLKSSTCFTKEQIKSKYYRRTMMKGFR